MLPPELTLTRRQLFGGLGRALLALTLLLAAVTPAARAATLKAGDTFPKLADAGLEGTLPDLSGKVVLVDFWASWCGPCKRSFPVMKELLDTYGPRGFVIVAISVDEKKAAMDNFLAKNPVAFAVVRDARGKLPEATGVERMPTSFLLSPDGKILAVHSGFAGDSTRAEYVKEIEAALKAAGR